MSDDFIPLNQSTPVQGRWQQGNQYAMNYQPNRFQNNSGSWTPKRGGHRNQGKKSRNNSFQSDGNNSFGSDVKSKIDMYLHPSMLQDPWANLTQKRTH